MKAFITGASSGIGEALAFLLAKKGYELFLSGRKTAPLQKTANQLQASFLVADLANKNERQELINTLCEYLPDLLINCAGYAVYAELSSCFIHQQLQVLEVNTIAPIECTLSLAQALIRAKKKGVILNVSSVAGEFPSPGMGLYGSAKKCLTHFSRTANTELAPCGVHVLVSCPGMIKTEFTNRAAGKSITQWEGPKMSSHYAAEQIWKQIVKRREKNVFGGFYRLATYLVPGFLAKRFIWRVMCKRLKM